MRTKLPPIKKTQVAAEPDNSKSNVGFKFETNEDNFADTKRQLITNIEMEKEKKITEEEINSPSPIKKILLTPRQSLIPNMANETNLERKIDFDEGIFLLQQTFNIKTSEILLTMKVFKFHIIYKNE